jgi:RHS repeat-associated protein
MLSKDISKSKWLKQLLPAAILLFTAINSQGQTLVTAPLTSSTLAAGSYYSNGSILMNPGFSVNGSTGTYQFYITTNCYPLATSASLNQNYILTTMPRKGGYVPGTLGYTTCDLMQTVQYFDGLGRPLQTVQVEASPLGNDIVQPVAYDQFGREATKYLPYALTGSSTSDGSYKANALTPGQGQAAFYASPPSGVSAIANPSASTGFEPSPLNRVLEQGAPGAPWQLSTSGISGSGHSVQMAYAMNNSITWAFDSVKSMQVALYNATVNTNQTRTLVPNSYYGAGQLYVTISKDENWVSKRAGTTEEYKDKEGHVVLKRVYNYTTSLQILSTYYVYDDLGNLAFVIPPAAGGDAATTISQTTLDNLCYQYRYDDRNRLVQKKIPGKGWEYIVYNKLNQPVLSQDANQRTTNQWTVTKYDALGRVIMTGLWNAGSVIPTATLQASIYAGAQWDVRNYADNTTGYTLSSYPTLSKTLMVNYYDNYTNLPLVPATYAPPSGYAVLPVGLLTATKTAVLNTITNTTPDMLWSVQYYDDLGRSIKTYAQHYLGGTVNANNYDAVTTTYNFNNQPTATSRQHFNTGNTAYPLVTIANTYNYDHTGRKISTWEQITNGNNAPDPLTNTLISQLDYNEIGQVLTKHLHSKDGNTFLQNIGYTYNERGWLLGSSAPLFAMSLYYNTLANKSYNGNIMYQFWGTPASQTNSFSYGYDKLNRLLAGSSTANNTEYMSYDPMGNLSTLSRSQTGTLIDNLTYTYTGNQLQSVNDATSSDLGLKHGTSSFTYDGNGNLITDPSKGATGISIAYNLLNLPQAITGSKTITYIYDAAGNKLRRVSPNTGNTDYINGIQYDGTTTPALSFIQTEEGKAVPNGTGYNYTYYLGDHLGNTRVTFDTKTGTAVQVQKDDYYPFGMEINSVVNGTKNEYLYNRKELQEELGQYDYGARFYDPVIARWTSVDPLADKYVNLSPFNYVANNPIKAVDPDGKKIIFVNGYIGFGSPPAGEKYWGGRSGSFVASAKDYFGDKNTQFLAYNPNMGSTAAERREAGRQYAKEHLKDLTAGMSKDEQFEIVSHSMGSAYSEGIEDVLKDNGYIVGQAVHINAFQAADIEDNQDNAAGTGVSTYSIDYQFTDDPVINNWFRSSPGNIKNATRKLRTQSNEKDIRDRHAGPIWQGKRVWNDIQNSFKIQSEVKDFLDKALQQNPNIKVTVKE